MEEGELGALLEGAAAFVIVEGIDLDGLVAEPPKVATRKASEKALGMRLSAVEWVELETTSSTACTSATSTCG